jgi:hypothetical protein
MWQIPYMYQILSTPGTGDYQVNKAWCLQRIHFPLYSGCVHEKLHTLSRFNKLDCFHWHFDRCIWNDLSKVSFFPLNPDVIDQVCISLQALHAAYK